MGIVSTLSEFATSNPGITAQIGISGVLAMATIAYTVATFFQILEMKRDRKVRIKPLVKPTIENKFAVHHFFAIENTGEGAAYNVEANWWSNPDDKHTWKIPILSPGERRTFPLPFGDDDDGRVTTSDAIEQAADGDSTVEFRVSYDDALGNTYSPCETPEESIETIDVLDTIEKREDASEYVDEDPIKAIADELENISDDMGNIKENLNMDDVNSMAREDLYRRVLEEVEEKENITFGHLCARIGVDSTLLTEIIYTMHQRGIVEYEGSDHRFQFQEDPDTEIEFIGNSN